jgi:type I restriction enzyme S subunit
MYPLTPKGAITRDYLYYLLISDDFTQYAIQGSTRAGMPKVNRNHLFTYKFQLAPLPEQRAIVNHLDTIFEKVKTLEANYTKIVTECDTLKQSILKQIFE